MPVAPDECVRASPEGVGKVGRRMSVPRHRNKLKRHRVIFDALTKGRVDVGSCGVGDEVTG